MSEGERVEEVRAEGKRGQQGNVQFETRAGIGEIEGREVVRLEADKGGMSGSKEEVVRKEWQIKAIDELCVNAADRMSHSKLN